MSDTTNTTPDLTVIYLTADEHPEHWEEFHWRKLMEATKGLPMIISTTNLLKYHKLLMAQWDVILQTEERSHYTMYRQLLRACKLATTPYIATAESDTLYSPEHFTFYRPPMDAVAYDMSLWKLFTWRPVFSIRRRITGATLIAPREYLIEALEERYGDNAKISKEESSNRAGEVGRHIHEDALGITRRNAKQVWCYHPSIQVTHPNGTGFNQAHHPYMKTLGEMKALEIPTWGRAEDIAKEYR